MPCPYYKNDWENADCPELKDLHEKLPLIQFDIKHSAKNVIISEINYVCTKFTSCNVYQLLEENEKLKSEYAQLIKDKYNIS